MTGIDYCFKVGGIPQPYKEAANSLYLSGWKNAMEEELNSLRENDTFEITTLPEGKHPVGGKWVYAIKEDFEGTRRFKARYVAKGYNQVKGIDYKETFAPTANITSIRILMQLVVQNDLIVHQMDVKTAYLHAPIAEEIYLEQPEGFEVLSDTGEKLVYKLKKSLYGLKQSGRNWNKVLHEYLVENDFVQNSSDHCVYKKQIKNDMIIVIIWVDDLIMAASDTHLLNQFKEVMQKKFRMKDLGKISYFLGIHFEQKEGEIKMSQDKYISKMLERFGMVNCKPRSTPCEQKLEYNSSEAVDPKNYREIVGSLIYAMTCTRPDLSWVVSRLSQHLSEPKAENMNTAKHVLRYLKGTIDHKLCFKKSSQPLRLLAYSDSDWASSVEDRRSTTGYCFSLTGDGPLVSWKSKKQPTVALSTCEAEYMALAATTQESLYLTQLLNGMDKKIYHCMIFEDNQGAISLSKDPVHRQRSKHIDVKYHSIRT